MSFIIPENSVTTVIAYNHLETSKDSMKENPIYHTNYYDPQTTGRWELQEYIRFNIRNHIKISGCERNILISMGVLKAFALIQHN